VASSTSPLGVHVDRGLHLGAAREESRVPFELSLLGGAVLATLVGVVIGYPSLRLRGVYFAMVTVAFVEVIRLIAQLWVSLTRGMSGLSGVPKPNLLGMTLTTKAGQYYLGLALMLIVLLILWKLEHSRLGLIWKSIGMADNLAQSLGVDIARHKLLAFMLGCFFAGSPARSTPTSSGSSFRRSSGS